MSFSQITCFIQMQCLCQHADEVDGLQKLIIALSNGTIVDPL